jgi:hypothetical protein
MQYDEKSSTFVFGHTLIGKILKLWSPRFPHLEHVDSRGLLGSIQGLHENRSEAPSTVSAAE